MKYILKVDFYKKEHKTIPIILYQDDWGCELLFKTNLDVLEYEMFSRTALQDEAYLIVKTPTTKTLRIPATKNGADYSVVIPREMTNLIGEYSYQLRVREKGQLNTSPVFYYIVKETVFSRNSIAVVDDSVVDEIVVGEDSFTYIMRNGYEKTVWVAHETVISAEKMNKIEGELERLSLGANGSIHIGSVAPTTTSGLWVDTKDENVEQLDRTIVDELTRTLREQRNLIDELYFINMNSLDAGGFEDDSDADIELDGGVY